MLYIRLSAESPKDLKEAIRYAADRFSIARVKRSESAKTGRYLAYLFVTPKAEKP